MCVTTRVSSPRTSSRCALGHPTAPAVPAAPAAPAASAASTAPGLGPGATHATFATPPALLPPPPRPQQPAALRRPLDRHTTSPRLLDDIETISTTPTYYLQPLFSPHDLWLQVLGQETMSTSQADSAWQVGEGVSKVCALPPPHAPVAWRQLVLRWMRPKKRKRTAAEVIINTCTE